MNAKQITVEKLQSVEHHGDWHDKPTRWQVKGPGAELQKFSTKKNAQLYRSIRRKAATEIGAHRAYVLA